MRVVDGFLSHPLDWIEYNLGKATGGEQIKSFVEQAIQIEIVSNIAQKHAAKICKGNRSFLSKGKKWI